MDIMEPLKGKNSISLEKFNYLSQGKKFSLADLDWSKGFDFTRRWAPPSIISLEYLESFQALPAEVKIRYNQLHALAICEIFSLFEGDYLGAILKVLRKDPPENVDPAFDLAIRNFLDEEEKHSEMFWRILQQAAPELYPTRNYLFAKSSLFNKRFLQIQAAFPHTFLVWIWMAIFFEERTLMYSKEYIKYAESHPHDIDPLFVKAHRLHMMEEVLHVRMDEALLGALYFKKSRWKKNLAGFMMKQIIKGFTQPKNISKRIIKQLKKEFPEIKNATYDGIMRDAKSIKWNKSFLEVHFGKTATERTRFCMQDYPEFKGIWEQVNL
jgi:hypothetical protein